MKFILLFFLVCFPLRAAIYQPPAERFGVYAAGTTQGINGGIPSRSGGNVISVTTYGWGAAESAATNVAAFNSALAASAAGDIISIPAGTFDITSLAVSYDKSNRTIRGAGMASTILKPSGQHGIKVGFDINNDSAPSSAVTAMTAGSATITVSDGSTFPTPSTESTYRIGQILLGPDAATPVIHNYGLAPVRVVTVMMTGRSGNNITLSQPLPSGFADGLTGAVFTLGFQLAFHTTGIGVEDLQIDGNDSGGVMTSGALFSFSSQCWAKNVKVIGQGNYGIQFNHCINHEMRRCWVDAGLGGGTNRGGLLHQFSSYGLIEDNIVVNNGPNFEINFSSTANIFSYNYLGDGILNYNHGPHNSFNLFEGNICWFAQSDGFFGGSSAETHLRNWYRGGVTVQQKRFTRYNNVIGNIIGIAGETYTTDGIEYLGNPNIGNNSSNGTAEQSTSDYWLDWDSANSRIKRWTGTVTTRTSDTEGVITLGTGQGTDFAASVAGSGSDGRVADLPGQDMTFNVTDVTGDVVTFSGAAVPVPAVSTAVTIYPSPDGFQERDLDVGNTTITKSNYYVFSNTYSTTNSIPAAETLGADTLPDSYAYTAQPSWWQSGLAWPPINPASPTFSVEIIPAGYRYVNGDSPVSSSSTSPSITTTNINIGG